MPSESTDPLHVPDFVRPDLDRLDVALTTAQITLLAEYLSALQEGNKRVNLTGINDPDEAWRRHAIDSLTLLPGLENLTAGRKLIDVGSGGGLPGIPLAIARPDVEVTLLEATGKKADFLEQCATQLQLPNVTVIHGRAEHVGQDAAHREKYDLVTARAIGTLREIVEYTLPLARIGGRVLAMKGPKAEHELRESGDALAILGAGDLQVFDAYPDGFGLDTVVISIVKDRPTPRAYPRPPGVPRKTPL